MTEQQGGRPPERSIDAVEPHGDYGRVADAKQRLVDQILRDPKLKVGGTEKLLALLNDESDLPQEREVLLNNVLVWLFAEGVAIGRGIEQGDLDDNPDIAIIAAYNPELEPVEDGEYGTEEGEQ